MLSCKLHRKQHNMHQRKLARLSMASQLKTYHEGSSLRPKDSKRGRSFETIKSIKPAHMQI